MAKCMCIHGGLLCETCVRGVDAKADAVRAAWTKGLEMWFPKGMFLVTTGSVSREVDTFDHDAKPKMIVTKVK